VGSYKFKYGATASSFVLRSLTLVFMSINLHPVHVSVISLEMDIGKCNGYKRRSNSSRRAARI